MVSIMDQVSDPSLQFIVPLKAVHFSLFYLSYVLVKSIKLSMHR